MLLELARKMVFAYPIFSILEKYKINNHRGDCKILIYQMGKVASSTVYETVKGIKPMAYIGHVHFLSENGIDEAEKYFRSTPTRLVPMHLRRSKLLRENIDLSKESIKLITLTRDPIARVISDLIQNVRYFYPDCVKQGSLDRKALLNIMQNSISILADGKDFASNWFDEELYEATGVDVYQYEFDSVKGYANFRKNNYEVLILQLEQLNDNLSISLKQLLGVKGDIKKIDSNVGEKKEYSNDLSYIKDKIEISETDLDRIYSTKYIQHFYSEEQIYQFKKRWRRSKN